MHDPLLKKSLDRYFLDGCDKYTKSSLAIYGRGDWPSINAQLKEWEERGLIKILKHPHEAADNDLCIEMLNFIDRESPIPGWPPKKA